MGKIDHLDLGESLLRNIDHTIGAVENKFHDLILHHHLSHWHPISTAPYNQDLELSIVDEKGLAALPFPCRRINDGKWINADLGIGVQIEPVRWRIWQKGK